MLWHNLTTKGSRGDVFLINPLVLQKVAGDLLERVEVLVPQGTGGS